MAEKRSGLCEGAEERSVKVEAITDAPNLEINPEEAAAALNSIKERTDAVLRRRAEEKEKNKPRLAKLAAKFGRGEKGSELTGENLTEALMKAFSRAEGRAYGNQRKIVDEFKKYSAAIAEHSLDPSTAWEENMIGEWAQDSGCSKRECAQMLADVYGYTAYNLKEAGVKSNALDEGAKSMGKLAQKYVD